MRIWTPKIEYIGRFITILLKNLFISHKINIPQKGGLYLHISLLIKTNCGKENIDRLKQKIQMLCLPKDTADRNKTSYPCEKNTGNIHNQESNHIYNSETPQIHRKKNNKTTKLAKDRNTNSQEKQ